MCAVATRNVQDSTARVLPSRGQPSMGDSTREPLGAYMYLVWQEHVSIDVCVQDVSMFPALTLRYCPACPAVPASLGVWSGCRQTTSGSGW